MSIKRAILPVGGKGTRFLPATKVLPKAMFPVGEKPIVHHIVEEAAVSGIEEIVFIVSANSRIILDYFDSAPELENILESKKDQRLLDQVRALPKLARFYSTSALPHRGLQGLGTAIFNAASFVRDEPFAVLLPNDLIDSDPVCLKALVAIFDAVRCPVLAVHRVPPEHLSTYGNVRLSPPDSRTAGLLESVAVLQGRVHEVTGLIQRPSVSKHEHLSDMAIIGRYILTPEIFQVLDRLEPGFGGEVQLTDALELLRRSGQRIFAYEFDGQYYDTRSKAGYLKACLGYSLTPGEAERLLCEVLGSNRG